MGLNFFFKKMETTARRKKIGIFAIFYLINVIKLLSQLAK